MTAFLHQAQTSAALANGCIVDLRKNFPAYLGKPNLQTNIGSKVAPLEARCLEQN